MEQDILKAFATYKAQTNAPPSAIRMSDESLRLIINKYDMVPRPDGRSTITIYGIPIVLDSSVPLGKFRIETKLSEL